MKQISKFTLILLFSALVCITTLSAEESQEVSFTSSRTNMGVKFGFSKPIKDHYEGGMCFGFNLSFFITSQLSLEFSGQQLRSEVTLEEDGLNSGTLTAFPAQLSLRYQFNTSSRFVPVSIIFFTPMKLTSPSGVRFASVVKMR